MSNLFSALFFLCINPLNILRMFSHFASDYAKLSNYLIFFLKNYLILLLIIPVLLSGFSNLCVSWTLVPKTPGARHSQGFSSTKGGSGLLTGFVQYTEYYCHGRERFAWVVPAFGNNSLLIPAAGTRCQHKAFMSSQVFRLLGGVPWKCSAHPPKGYRVMCLQAPFPICTSWHSQRHPTQRVSEAWKSRLSQVHCLPLGTQMSLGQIKLSRNYSFLLPAYCLLQALTRKYKGTVWISGFFPAVESLFCFCFPNGFPACNGIGLAQL